MRKIRLNMERKDGYPCVKDQNYEETMQMVVEPYLKQFKKSGWYEREENKPLYYEMYMPDEAVGSVIISHGYTESIQKYKEVIYYFLKEHYNVFLMDHRGHGKSFREVGNNDFSLTHVVKFSDYVEDLNGFIEEIAVKKAGEDNPFYLYAHSMGGAIGTRYLQLYPGRIKKAVLTAPMLDIKLNIPRIEAEAVAHYMVKTGRTKKYIIGQKAFSGEEAFEEASCSSRERYDYYFKKRAADRELQNNAGSYSWLYESLRVIKQIEKEKTQIQIPVCIFSAENDDLVTMGGHLALARKTPDSRLIFVPETKHEIYMAPSRIQEQYWRYLFAFLKGKSKTRR
ncbi:MAG: alpha/beta hydrolase [Lachnospiraceae bacterium]|nr:alpha/beta hydrolase [Lachnospiraceae bacterium]